MSTLGIQAATAKIADLTCWKEVISQKTTALKEDHLNFSILLDLIVADSAAMQLGKDIGAVYECMREDISNPYKLGECANTLLNFYKNGVNLAKHLRVEDAICAYIKLKAWNIIGRCRENIGALAQGRELASLPVSDLAQVMHQQSIIFKVIPQGISKEERQRILKCTREVLQRDAFADIPESDELTALNAEIVIKPLDVLLTEAKDRLCQMEGRANLGDIGAHLGIVRFLMATLSTHVIMVKKEREESVTRLCDMVNTVDSMYRQHGLSQSAEIHQRIFRLNEKKSLEILDTAIFLAKDPLRRKIQSSKPDFEAYNGAIGAYDLSIEIVDDSVKALRAILEKKKGPCKTCQYVAEELSDEILDFLEQDDLDPLYEKLESIIEELETVSLEAITDEFLEDKIKSLTELKKSLYVDHLSKVVDDIPLDDDEVPILLGQLSGIV